VQCDRVRPSVLGGCSPPADMKSNAIFFCPDAAVLHLLSIPPKA